MQTDRYDWVMMEVEAVGKATRKIAVALLDAEDQELVEIEEQTDSLLEDAFDHARMALVDTRTAAMILRPPRRIREYARLLGHKSVLLQRLGQASASASLARRALELQLEAAELEVDPSKIDHESIEQLLDRDPPLHLGPRHRALLEPSS